MNEAPDKDTVGPGKPDRGRSLLQRIFLNEDEMRAGWRFLVYVVLTVLMIMVLSFAAMALHLPLPVRHDMHAMALLVGELVQAGGAFGAALLMGKFEHRTIGTYGLPARRAFRGNFWQGIGWGLGMITALMLLIAAFGGFSFGGIDLSGGTALRYAVIWGAVFLLTGFFEEFAFRGYTLFTLTSGVGFWPAAVLMSAGFGAVHLTNPGEGIVGALSVFMIGMFFCLTLRRTGSLWFAVGLHAAWDWGETFFYSVPDSGIVAPGHLLKSSLHGPAWLSGGTVGPEGSVFAFVVMTAAFVIFALAYKGRPARPESAVETASAGN